MIYLEKIIPLEGAVTDVGYRNFTGPEFPIAPIIATLDTTGSNGQHERVFVTGQNKPPILAGQYMHADVVKITGSDGLWYLVAVRLRLSESKGGKHLLHYEHG